jgi:hypothetical protein
MQWTMRRSAGPGACRAAALGRARGGCVGVGDPQVDPPVRRLAVTGVRQHGRLSVAVRRVSIAASADTSDRETPHGGQDDDERERRKESCEVILEPEEAAQHKRRHQHGNDADNSAQPRRFNRC